MLKNTLLAGVLLLGACATPPSADTMKELRTVRTYTEVVVKGALQAAKIVGGLGYLDQDTLDVLQKISTAAPIAFTTADRILNGTEAGTPEAAISALQGVLGDALVAYDKLGVQ